MSLVPMLMTFFLSKVWL